VNVNHDERRGNDRNGAENQGRSGPDDSPPYAKVREAAAKELLPIFYVRCILLHPQSGGAWCGLTRSGSMKPSEG
jgi:hypothetical protein